MGLSVPPGLFAAPEPHSLRMAGPVISAWRLLMKLPWGLSPGAFSPVQYVQAVRQHSFDMPNTPRANVVI